MEGGQIIEHNGHGGGGKGIKLFGKKLPMPLLLVGGGGIVVLFLAMRGRTSGGSASTQAMPTPPGGQGTNYGYSGYDPVTGLPVPAGYVPAGSIGAASGTVPATTTVAATPAAPVLPPIDMFAEGAKWASGMTSVLSKLTPTTPTPTVTPPSTLSPQTQQQIVDAFKAKLDLVKAHPQPSVPSKTGMERLSGTTPYDQREARMLAERAGRLEPTTTFAHREESLLVARGKGLTPQQPPGQPQMHTTPHPTLGVVLPFQHNHVAPVPVKPTQLTPAPAARGQAPKTQPRSLPIMGPIEPAANAIRNGRYRLFGPPKPKPQPKPKPVDRRQLTKGYGLR